MKKMMLVIFLVAFAVFASAQYTISPTLVELEAEDGLTLIADYYAADTEDTAPAVLLLHMLGSDRTAWEPLIQPLVDSGYHILNMDMRGHGETGGSRDWDAVLVDTQIMLNWLKDQQGVGSVGIIGASIGSNIALLACGNDPDCVTAIALSPGLDYSGVQPAPAVENDLAERSALLVGALNDGRVAESIYTMAQAAPGEIGVRIYTGRAHGTRLFSDQGEPFAQMLIAWLDEQTAA